MKRVAFYPALRGSALFPHGLTKPQVAGFENLLNVLEQSYAADPVNDLAYDLAPAFHETTGTMQPIVERGARSYFNKYEPGTKLGKMLGNTVKGEGYRFRDGGHVQNTGRRNAKFASDRLNEAFGLGIDLVASPEKRGDPFISAHSLFPGNCERWRTDKNLYDVIDENDAEDFREFIASRQVVNGTDKAAKIGGHGARVRKGDQGGGLGR